MLRKKIGVVLFQLGGPDSIEAIEPFLYNLFCDPDIIDFPFARIARQPLARLIATRRAKYVAHHYAGIGGKSPLLEFTRRQADRKSTRLNSSHGYISYAVFCLKKKKKHKIKTTIHIY